MRDAAEAAATRRVGRSGGVGEGGREMERRARAPASGAGNGVEGGVGGAGNRHARISDRLMEKGEVLNE